jgi:hypothetical protein
MKEHEGNHRGHRGGGNIKSSKLLILKKFSVFSVVSLWHYQSYIKEVKK